MQEQIFFDASILIQAGVPPGGPELAQIAHLAEAGIIKVLSTEHTISEVAKHHAERDIELIKDLSKPKTRSAVRLLLGVELPNFKLSDSYKSHLEQLSREIRDVLTNLDASILSMDAADISSILKDYVNKEGLFLQSNKKHQFPDAVIFSVLKAHASKGPPITIVSNDSDFDAAVGAEASFTLVKSIPDLLDQLGFTRTDYEIDDFLDKHKDELIEIFDEELDGWTIYPTDVEDADIDDTDVSDVSILETAVYGRNEFQEILVVGTARITAQANFSHPSWENAIYDSEDKQLIPWDDDVSGQSEISVETRFAMTVELDEDGNPREITEVRFSGKPLFAEIYGSDLDY